MRGALLVLLVLAAACGDDDGDGSAATTTLPLPGVEGPGDPAREELDELLTLGRTEPVHAVYESEGDTTALGGDVRIELWRAGDRARYDTRFTSEAGTADTVVVVGPGGGESCTREGDAPFECQPTDDTAADVLLLAPLADGRDLEAYDDEIGGVDARCFRVDDDLGEGSVCVDGQGVPLLLTTGDARLVRVSLDAEVPESVFDTASLSD